MDPSKILKRKDKVRIRQEFTSKNEMNKISSSMRLTKENVVKGFPK
jgi:aspartate carbamoyltransferase regulatory subunit